MSEFRTDEESIELIRNWWKDNGTFLLVGIGVVIAAVIGWQAWQKYQKEQADLASSRFTQYREAVVANSQISSETRALLLQQLKEEHSRTGYGALAALLEAKRLVERSELDAASKELDWVVQNGKNPEIVDLAKLRLARVHWAKGDVDQALKDLEGVDSAGYASLIEELRGDLLLAKGDRNGAHAAYVRALDAAKGTPQPLLEIKRDDVASTATTAPAPATAGG
jgi:predicted negative regulator of RcsB-dependent stress response